MACTGRPGPPYDVALPNSPNFPYEVGRQDHVDTYDHSRSVVCDAELVAHRAMGGKRGMSVLRSWRSTCVQGSCVGVDYILVNNKSSVLRTCAGRTAMARSTHA
jgi:hypothetical protein